VYLPTEILARHGIAKVNPNEPVQRPKLHSAALELLDLADHYYASAYIGIGALPLRSAWAIAAARRVYRDIGNKLRRNGPAAWDNRVSTSKTRKYALLGLALFDVLASRFKARQDVRTGLWQRP
jgi:15-cis-phytoene synthase